MPIEIVTDQWRLKLRKFHVESFVLRPKKTAIAVRKALNLPPFPSADLYRYIIG